MPRAAARDEVVARDVDAFAAHQAAEVVVEQVEVDGFERLVVVIAVGVARGLFAVDEIVVERDQHRLQPQYAELDAQPFGRGGLAARRGARDEHHAHAARDVGVVDRVGDPRELAFVECLGQFDHAACVAREHLGVDGAHGGHAHDPHPGLVFLEDAEHLFLFDVGVEPVGRRAQRQGEVEPVVVGFDAEQVDEPCRGRQRAVEITVGVAERIEVAVKPRAGVQQGDLVGEALGRIAGADFAREDLHAADRQVLRHQVAHAPFECLGQPGREFVDALDLAVKAVLPHRMADMERLARKEIAGGFLQDEPRRALVDADAGEGGDVHETDGHRGIYFVIQFLDAVVDQGGKERVGPRRDPLCDLGKRGAHRHLDRAAEVFAYDFDDICHKIFRLENM